jgi:N-methylhydantoinase A
VLTLDVGGTSADVAAIVDGESVTSSEHAVAGLDVRLPALDIHTISAGGGSIAWIDDGGALRVGPHSAGADPGPACYQRGGEQPTLTDAHLMLGNLQDGARLGAAVTLSRAAAERALARVGASAGMDAGELAAGFVRVADDAIARALHHVTVARGLDPRRFALMAFGGAGGLHACRVAEQLEVGTVVIPAAAGVLSALGLARAALRLDAARSLVAPLSELDGRLDAAFAELEAQLRAKLPHARTSRHADLRYRRQAHELTVAADELAGLAERFHAAHERRHGYAMREEPVELVTIRAAASVEAPDAGAGARWQGPAPGERVRGPAIVAYPDSTCVVPEGWSGAADESGALVLERAR